VARAARGADGDGRRGSFRGRATSVRGGTRRGCVPGAAAGLAWEEASVNAALMAAARPSRLSYTYVPIIDQNLYVAVASHFAVYSALCLRLSAQEHLSTVENERKYFRFDPSSIFVFVGFRFSVRFQEISFLYRIDPYLFCFSSRF
jgi:hypothetical protein